MGEEHPLGEIPGGCSLLMERGRVQMEERMYEERDCEQGRLARAWAFTKRHAVPIGIAVGGVALTVAGVAMPPSARKGIADGARKLLKSDGAKRVAVVATATVAAAATAPTERPVERTLMGLPEARLNEIAQGVYHGISAAFDEFGYLIFKYKSNSGRSVMSARISAGPDGIGIDQGLANISNASTLPRIFMRRVLEEAAKLES